jgi:protein-L-isoaspartate(D-aspartate) O-methyltransferase
MFIPIIISIIALWSRYFPPNSRPEEYLEGKTDDSFSEQRQQMVRKQIQQRGVTNPKVLAAMTKVPRHHFVPSYLAHLAYTDAPLPLDYGQTISQPYIVAYMTEILDLKPEDKVLEIGTGSGYQTAVLAELAQAVYSIEIIPELAHKAQQTLRQLNYYNIHLRIGDGYEGWPEQAPYQGILATAAPERIPPALVDQLAVNGKIVIPVGKYCQQIVIVTKTNDGLIQEKTLPVRFVPMVSHR